MSWYLVFGLVLFVSVLVVATPLCIRGDANGSGLVNEADVVDIVGYVFGSGEGLLVCNGCILADVDGNGLVDIGDAVRLFSWIMGYGGALRPC